MTLKPELEARIAYGRSIRERASCLIAAHGAAAEIEARRAAAMAGAAAPERRFWDAVAARIVRLTAPVRRQHEF